MKTKELTNYLRDRGLVGEITDSKITVYKNGRLIAYVSVDCLYGIHIYQPGGMTEGLYRRMTDYGKTPLEEREEEKLYRVKFPGITKAGNPIYLSRDCGPADPIGLDWSDNEFIYNDTPEDYIFTEKEIKAIHEAYWEFAEGVEG